MIRAIIEKLTCKHQWEERSRASKESTISGNILSVSVLYICAHCGKMKRQTYE
jgi:hypothetical protein